MNTAITETEKQQIISERHHMGIHLINFESSDVPIRSDDNALTEHDIVEESLKLKTSSKSSEGFKLGAANVASCQYQIIRNDNPLTEMDLSLITFDAYLTNKLTDSDGSYLTLADTIVNEDVDASYAELDIAFTNFGEELFGMDVSVRVNYTYRNGYALGMDVKTFTYVPTRKRIWITDYVPTFKEIPYSGGAVKGKLYDVTIRIRATTTGGEIFSYTIVPSLSNMIQCTYLKLGHFVIEDCDLATDVMSRDVKAFDAYTHHWLDRNIVTYENGDVVILGDLLSLIDTARLLDIDLDYTTTTYTDNYTSSDNPDKLTLFKISGLPGDATIGINLEETTFRSTIQFDDFGAVLFTFITTGGESASDLLAGILSEFGVDEYIRMLTAWINAYNDNSTTSVKYLIEHVDEILHCQPKFSWTQNDNGKYILQATHKRIRSAYYTGHILEDKNVWAHLGFTESQTLYISDITSYKIDDSNYFSEESENYLHLGESDERIDYIRFSTSFYGTVASCSISISRIKLNPLIAQVPPSGTEEGSIFVWYWTTLEEWTTWFEETQLIPALIENGIMDDDGNFFYEDDETSYNAILNAIRSVLQTIHDTYYPGATYERDGIDYDYIPVEVTYESLLPTGEYAWIYMIDDFSINCHKWVNGSKIIDFTDIQDSQTGYIYKPRDKEIENYTIKRYTNEELANMMMQATANGNLTYRQVLSAYAELKGCLYDGINHRLVRFGGLFPSTDLYPETDLYPVECEGGSGIYVTDVRVFPSLDIYPGLNVFPEAQNPRGSNGQYTLSMLRVLTKYKYDNPLMYYAIRAQTINGIQSAYVFDEDNTDKSIYELSNVITTLFDIPNESLLYDELERALFGAELQSVDARIVAVPWLEIGDYISINYEDSITHIMLYDKELRGIQGAYDIINQKQE